MGALFKKICSCLSDSYAVDNDVAIVDPYIGEKNCFGQKHGYGSYMFTNGDIYEGCWKYDLMHGFGVYTFSSGEKKEGFFENGSFIRASGEYVSGFTHSSEVHPIPFVQTTSDDAERKQRQLEREKRKQEREKLREERKKRRDEFFEKYGKRVGRERQAGYGATKPR